ncbi:hypothetical protein MNBD_GAMMA10-1125 [hydrothermal vent metagenome]|uniref:Uncharacterized protein n=1 Tax=hydrothermal vent metagenome TaxID=652676 RepID=A0A3B0XZU4_9ZZZZ
MNALSLTERSAATLLSAVLIIDQTVDGSTGIVEQ